MKGACAAMDYNYSKPAQIKNHTKAHASCGESSLKRSYKTTSKWAGHCAIRSCKEVGMCFRNTEVRVSQAEPKGGNPVIAETKKNTSFDHKQGKEVQWIVVCLSLLCNI